MTAPLAARLLQAWALLAGASIGSFLNVVIARLPAGQSIVTPRSRCPRCGAPIAWYDNVPVLSWLLLRARCRACAGRISARYPLVELAGGAAALLALRRHGPTGAAAAELALVALLLALALVDLDTWLLPHALTGPLLAGALLLAPLGVTPAGALGPAAAGAAIGVAVLAAVALLGRLAFRREAMGFGDVWLLGGLGGWLGVKALLPVVLLASLQGVLAGLLLAAAGRLPRHASTDGWVPPESAVPFGPFLVAGALEWLYLSGWLARLAPPLALFR